jgi:hypothetical protein
MLGKKYEELICCSARVSCEYTASLTVSYKRLQKLMACLDYEDQVLDSDQENLDSG